MSIPSKADLDAKTKRLADLLGPGFSIIIRVDEWNSLYQYLVSAYKHGHYINWTMIEDDFNIDDHDLVLNFINPAIECFERAHNAKQS